MPLFHKLDFSVYANRTKTIRIDLKDNRCQWLVPPFTTGYFGIAPLAIPPVLQTAIPPIFVRNTNGLYVRFTNPLDDGAPSPEWFLDSDILPADTVGLAPGIYYYEARLDFGGGQYQLKDGLFRLKLTIL